jgi:uncharacterized protein YjeT (DUF2065 family)
VPGGPDGWHRSHGPNAWPEADPCETPPPNGVGHSGDREAGRFVPGLRGRSQSESGLSSPGTRPVTQALSRCSCTDTARATCHRLARAVRVIGPIRFGPETTPTVGRRREPARTQDTGGLDQNRLYQRINDEMTHSSHVMETVSKRKLGAVLAIGQGLVTAVAPQLSTRMIRQMIQGSFDNADDLVAKPSYVRRLRAIGIGLAAAGVASLTMELVGENSDDR